VAERWPAPASGSLVYRLRPSGPVPKIFAVCTLGVEPVRHRTARLAHVAGSRSSVRRPFHQEFAVKVELQTIVKKQRGDTVTIRLLE
jgi:hypothetical protein